MINVYANFDILYLMYNLKYKYNELNIYEINVMLYLALLLSLYDGSSSDQWGYIFTNNECGSPLSSEITLELDKLCRNNNITQTSESFYTINENTQLEKSIEALSKQYKFKWRLKYTQCAIDSIISKSLPFISNAIQNEPEISNLKALNRHSTLHDQADINIDNLFDDFRTLKDVIGDERKQILVPASIYLEYLYSR